MASNAIRISGSSVRRSRFKAIPREENGDDIVRTTLILPKSFDRNVEAYCIKEGVTKNTALLKLLSEGLSIHGYQPNRTPKVTISY